MKKAIAMAVSAALLTGAAAGGESRKARLNIEPSQPRQWQHWGNKVGVFTGTFDHLTRYRAFIKDPYDRMLEIPLFYFSAPDLSYMETQLTLRNLPEEVIDWTIAPSDKSRNKLIDVSAVDLPLGDFKEMANKGILGGTFINANRPPLVEMVAGRKAITFMKEPKVGTKYPRYQMLTGTFTLRERLDRNEPFTMCAWVYTEHEGTILDWHSLGGDHGTRLSFGHCDVGGMSQTSRGAKGENKHPHGLEGAPRWQHVSYVYTGGIDGEFRIYRDGNVTCRTQYDNIVHRKPLRVKEIGTTNAVIRCDLLAKTGEAWAGLYMGTIDHHNWHQLRHWHWQRFSNADWQPDGEVEFEMKGLEPGTRYYYRILSTDERSSGWGYEWDPSRRWCYGPGSFVTATEDGKPGYNIPEDTRKHFFIGADWSAEWYYANSGPSKWFRGSISSIQLFDYAMTDLEIREHAGLNDALNPVPEDNGDIEALQSDLAWERGDSAAQRYNVYISSVKTEVEDGSIAPVQTQSVKIENHPLDHGKRYFWRVEQLDEAGKTITRGRTWTFRTVNGVPRNPSPGSGSSVNPMFGFGWTLPPRKAQGVNLYLAKSEDELAAMTEPTQFLKGAARGYSRPRQQWVRGRTYYWRMDIVQEDGYVSAGPVWHFTIKPYFTPESDTVSQEPLPDGMKIADTDWGGKMMEENTGHPAITTGGAETFHLRHQVHGTARMLGKSEAVSLVCDAENFGTSLSSFEGGKCGWYSGLAGGCSYGRISKDTHDLLFHEMGHQVYNLLGKAVPGYGKRIIDLWLGHADDNVGLGGYNANNDHENMAVNCHMFLKAVERDKMYHGDYRQYVAIKEYLPAELYIELDAKQRVVADGNGVVKQWYNNAGFEHWTMGQFEKIEGTVGTFHAHGDPTLGTVEGVTCVLLDGDDALEWDLETRWALHGNRDFAVEFWALKNREGAPGQVLAAWGGDEDGARFVWGSGEAAYRHCGSITGTWGKKPALGRWQHIVQLYRGGGETPGAGPYEVYVNGKRVHSGTHLFAMARNAKVTVGGLVKNGTVSRGFDGALAHVRIYDYDLSPYQIDNHYAEEAPAYHRDKLAVAGKLYVDMDARYFADVPQVHHRPFYKAKLRKPWLRSWANHGTLGGRVHNDIHSVMWGYSGSRPRLRTKMGTPMPTFEGADRMVAGFEPDVEAMENPPRTLELWLENDARSDDEVILEWDDFQLTAEGLPKGRQCVTIVFDAFDRNDPKLKEGDEEQQKKAWTNALASVKGTVYVNGETIDKTTGILLPGDGRRLHLGGHYDMVRWNWKHYFNGTIAAVRVHKNLLTSAQIKANVQSHVFSPGNSGVVEPKPAPAKPLIHLDTSKLGKGPLTDWPNRGTAGGSFVPGKRGKEVLGLPVLNFKGIPGVHLGRQLVSSFDVPAALNKGPFTIYAYGVSTLATRGTTVMLGWGKEGEGARLYHGSLKVERGVKPARAFVIQGDPPVFELPRFVEEVHPYANPHMSCFWKPIVLSYDGRTMRYYADGVLTSEEEVRLDVKASGKLTLGSKGGGQRSYLSELRIFSRALNEKEIKALMPGTKVAVKDCLVAIEVPGLEDGTHVMTLPNTGTLGGSLDAPKEDDHAPNVAEIDGVRCVRFDGESDFLVSTLTTPRTLTGNRPFTVEIKAYADRGNTKDREEVIFALAPRMGSQCRDTTFCSPGLQAIIASRGRHRYQWETPATIGKWLHLTYVYEGGRRSRIRFFVNGKLVNTCERRSFATIPGYSMYIGSAFSRDRGEEFLYQGAVASVKAYDYVRSDDQIKAAAE